MTENERTYYAERFNSIPRNVRSWGELSNTAKNAANCMFINNGPEYVYLVSTYGEVPLARRKRDTAAVEEL